MTDPGSPSRPNRYEQVAEEMRSRERAAQRAYGQQPFGPFLLKQLAWGCIGALLGGLLGSLTFAVVNFVVFAGVGLVLRAYSRWRYRKEDPTPGGSRP